MNIAKALLRDLGSTYDATKLMADKFSALCKLSDCELMRMEPDGAISLHIGSIIDDIVITVTFCTDNTVFMSWMQPEDQIREYVGNITLEAAVGQYLLLTAPIDAPEISEEQMTKQAQDYVTTQETIAANQKTLLTQRVNDPVCSKCDCMYDCDTGFESREYCDTYATLKSVN